MSIEKSAKKILTASMLLAIFVGALTAGFISESSINNSIINGLVNCISNIIPAVNVIAFKTDYISVARITIAMQWLFFPIYLFLFCVQQPPWREFKFEDAITYNVRRKGVFASSIIFFFCFLFVISDFGLADASIMRGNFFDPSFGVFWLRLPFDGKFGLFIASVAMPFLDAFCYYFSIFSIGVVIRFVLRKVKVMD